MPNSYFSLGVNRPKREADHSPSANVEVKNECSCNSPPLHAFLDCKGTTFTLPFIVVRISPAVRSTDCLRFVHRGHYAFRTIRVTSSELPSIFETTSSFEEVGWHIFCNCAPQHWKSWDCLLRWFTCECNRSGIVTLFVCYLVTTDIIRLWDGSNCSDAAITQWAKKRIKMRLVQDANPRLLDQRAAK